MSDNMKQHVIPLSEPVISGNEWKYIKECLDSTWVSSVGSYVTRFEKMVSDYVGTKHAVAVVNGTSAIHISLLASGVCPDDEVIVPALTFIAPVNAVKYCNSHPVFMDCDDETLCMDVQKVVEFISRECKQKKDGRTYNKKTGRRISAILPVHIFGHPVDMNDLVGISRKYNISIIEDATESLGSEYRGRKTGSFGSLGCFSFNGNKIITTGGGGMVVSNNKKLADRVRHLTTQANKKAFEYYHDEIGYNYRLTNLQAAMGVAQMERLGEFIEIKRRNAAIYRELLSPVEGVEMLWEKSWARSNFWLCTIKVPQRHKSRLMKFLLSKEIRIRPVWKLINTLPMYKACQSYSVEKAVDAHGSCINLPCGVGIKQADIKFVAENIKEYFKRRG